MKVLKYRLMTEVNHGTEEQPDIQQIFSDVSLGWSEANEELAKREAYNGEYTIVDDAHLRGTTAHINVGKAALVGVCFLYQVVVEELCLLLTLDDFEFDAGLLLYLLEHLLAVLGIAHG